MTEMHEEMDELVIDLDEELDSFRSRMKELIKCKEKCKDEQSLQVIEQKINNLQRRIDISEQNLNSMKPSLWNTLKKWCECIK